MNWQTKSGRWAPSATRKTAHPWACRIPPAILIESRRLGWLQFGQPVDLLPLKPIAPDNGSAESSAIDITRGVGTDSGYTRLNEEKRRACDASRSVS